jgi:menaquinone-specific isochorismate synthase
MTSAEILSFLRTGAVFSTAADKIIVCHAEFTSDSAPKSGRQALYIPDFFLHDRKPWQYPSHWESLSLGELESSLEAFEEKIALLAWMPYRKKTYIGFVADLQRRLRSGELRKCVPVIFEYARQSLSPGMVCSLMLNLVRYAKRASVNLYGFWGRGQGIVGATPELLFEIPQTGMLRTMALASTQPSAACQQLLFESKKQRNEHDIVVESIVRSLKPHGFVSTGATTVLNLPNLTHLLTPIELQFSGRLSFLEAVRSLHPTPALGGEPKGAAWQWLKGKNPNSV